MDLHISNEQRQLVDAFRALYARESTGDRVRAAEPEGFDPRLWTVLRDNGVLEMAVPEEAGGWGASDFEVALIAEQHGVAVGSAPLIETQVAARLLARCAGAGTDSAGAALSAVLAADETITFAPRAAVADRLALVPAGSVADRVVALAGEALVIAPLAQARTPVENLGSMPLADVVLPTGHEVLATGIDATAWFSDAVDHWLVWTAAALVGIGARALEIGTEYAKQREAFGAPIGSFQAISHPLADCAAAIDGARLLAYEAACSFTDEPDRAAELAAMAFVFAYEAARDTTYRSLHTHGGYGFVMEQDIQLYYRRARGWANVYAEPTKVLERVADARYGLAGA